MYQPCDILGLIICQYLVADLRQKRDNDYTYHTPNDDKFMEKEEKKEKESLKE